MESRILDWLKLSSDKATAPANSLRFFALCTGNERSTRIYNPTSNSWRFGPIFPHDASLGASVGYEHTFLALGGDAGDLRVYKYNFTTNAEADRYLTVLTLPLSSALMHFIIFFGSNL